MRPEQFKPVEKDGKLFGRGSFDMKAAAVILTDAFCEYVDKVPYALGLQIVTDEERSGVNGAQHQISQGVRADFVICGECGRQNGTYEIANECKGITVVEVDFDGTAAHGAYLWRGQNALLRATKFTDALLARYPVPDEEVQRTTVNVASFSTNNGYQTKVPNHATVRFDIRFVGEDPNFRSPQHMAALFEEIDPGARVSKLGTFSPPMYTNPENPLLLQLKAAAEATEGHKFKFVRRHATSDGRHFAAVGDQACEFGLAGEDQHGDNEHITLEAFGNYRKTMRTFLKKSITREAHNTNTVAYQAA